MGGRVLGQGSLVSEGAMHLHGSTDLASTERIAVVSVGDLTLDGVGAGQSYFRGILYTRGKLTAHGLMVLGCLLGAAPGPPAGAQIDLQDCAILQDTQATGFSPQPPIPATGRLSRQEEDSLLFQERVQLVAPGRIRLSLSIGSLAFNPTTAQVFEIDVENAASRARLITGLRNHLDGATTLSIGHDRVGATATVAAPPARLTCWASVGVAGCSSCWG